ncbi:MAG: glutamate 5-kinase [Candidatus Nanohaloarchaea archaeon]
MNSSFSEVAVVGCGNMGSAIAKGLSQDCSVTGIDRNRDKLEEIESLDERRTDFQDVEADLVFLAVKPGDVEEVLSQMELTSEQILVSVAAGITVEWLEERTEAKVVRLMPNLAAEFRETAGAVTFGQVKESDKEAVTELLEELGTVVDIDESQMDAATAINGSGPAFVYYLMKAMREAGRERGLEKEKAEKLAVQTFRGASRIVSETDRDIEELIDAVCSPNGTTIEGMEVLRESDVERQIDRTVGKTTKRSREITRNYSGTGDRDRLEAAERVVVKIGTSSLTNGSGVDRQKLEKIAEEVNILMEEGREVILVTSGAIGAGKCVVSEDIQEMQAASTIGQSKLMSTYSDAFETHDREVAQLLLTSNDLEKRERFQNFRNTVEKLLDWDVVPIINENDAVAVEEIKLGDNDIIASMVAAGIDADLLVTLTDVNGIHTEKPGNGDAERISLVEGEDQRIERILENTDREFGGVKTKIEGAKRAVENGVSAVIADSSTRNVLERILSGEDIGTYFRVVE